MALNVLCILPHTAERHEYTNHHASVLVAWRRCVVAPHHPLILSPSVAYRAQYCLLGDTSSEPLAGVCVESWRVHTEAMELGILSVHLDTFHRLIYLGGDGCLIYSSTRLIIADLIWPYPQAKPSASFSEMQGW